MALLTIFFDFSEMKSVIVFDFSETMDISVSPFQDENSKSLVLAFYFASLSRIKNVIILILHEKSSSLRFINLHIILDFLLNTKTQLQYSTNWIDKFKICLPDIIWRILKRYLLKSTTVQTRPIFNYVTIIPLFCEKS